jgi:hypothetical protein
MNSAANIKKAFGMPSAADSAHQYIFKSGEYGTLYQYWWRDRLGNYYRYSNAPQESADFDPFLGAPLLDADQPLVEKNPEFFTQEGYKRHMAPPQGAKLSRNSDYNQNSSQNIWFEVFDNKGTKYIYLDADVKENLDLYVQNQLRIVDAALPKFREHAVTLFNSKYQKDRITGAILILCDQGYYEPEELIAATVGDVEFVDQAVILLGRKFVCDLTFLDFITSLVAHRAPTEPLFQYNTIHGIRPVGINYISSVFYATRVSPKFLLNWNASHLFSRIVNRMAFQMIPADEVEVSAFDELSKVLSTRDDVHHLVDFKVRVALLRNYREQVADPSVTKSLTRLLVDDFGVAIIRCDLNSLRQDEKEFSDWLQSTPMHDTSPAIEAQVEQELQPQEEEENEQPEQPPPSPEDAEEPPPTPDTEVPE